MKKLGMMDDTFLRLESRRQPLHVGMLMLFEPPAGAPGDFATRLAEKLRQSTKAAPPFNWRLVRRNGLHYWREDSDFDLAHHFVHLALPEPGRVRELLSMVSRLHGGHLDRAYPLWRIYLIEGLEDGRIAVYLKIHHAVVDGVAGIRLLVKCMATNVEDSLHLPAFWEVETMKSDNAQPLPVPTPAVGGIAALRSLTREGVKSVMPLLRELRSSIDDYRAANPNLVIGGQAPRCLFNEPVTGTRRFAAQSYSTPRIKAVAKAHEATSNDVILAMCGGALRRYLAEVDTLPDAPLIAGVPVSVRRRRSDAAGNEIAFTLAHLATNIEDPVERRVAIKNCMQYNKERIKKLSPGQLTAYAATMMMPGALSGLLGRNPDKNLANVIVSHVPGPRQHMFWQGARLSGLYPLSLIIDGGALNITVISRHDLVDFGLVACRKTVPHMQRILQYLEDSLAELEASSKPQPRSTGKAAIRKKTKPRPKNAKAGA
ncbi:MAG: wax ester/triacylglycerol synthase family O-acyltransferase [Gammaproteobacteria bacterium]|nr:wax ester/triacylglycerol synthase family O-acyltransferase [Gammaproteobacteria bacterium]